MILAVVFTLAFVGGLVAAFLCSDWRYAAADKDQVVGFNVGMLFAAVCAWIGAAL